MTYKVSRKILARKKKASCLGLTLWCNFSSSRQSNWFKRIVSIRVSVDRSRRNGLLAWSLASAIMIEGKRNFLARLKESSFVLEKLRLTSHFLPPNKLDVILEISCQFDYIKLIRLTTKTGANSCVIFINNESWRLEDFVTHGTYWIQDEQRETVRHLPNKFV